jgi:nitrite reductase (NADH) small subunit
MHRDLQLDNWTPVCTLDEIVPNTGVCALVGDEQVAVFRVAAHVADAAPQDVYAIANYDPNSDAAVLSRGLVGNLGERIVVASPIYKQHFDLATGECLEAPANSVHAYATKVENGRIWVGV